MLIYVLHGTLCFVAWFLLGCFSIELTNLFRLEFYIMLKSCIIF